MPYRYNAITGELDLSPCDGGGPLGYVNTFITDVSGPVTPNASEEVTITGSTVFSDGSVANTITLDVQATANTFLIGAGSNTAVTELGPLTDGQVIFGVTAGAPVAGSIVTANSTPVFTYSSPTLTLDFGKPNLALGSSLSTVSGTGNVCLGNTAGNSLTTANDNVFLGTNAGTAATSGGLNIAIGSNALTSAGAAADNIAIGYNAMTAANSLNANSNVAIGSQSCVALTQGNDTVAIGYQSLNQITTGGSNVAVGYQSGTSYTSTESFNILIGNSVTGTLGESNATRIGSNQSTCYIDGIDNVNVGNVVKVVTMGSNDQLGTADITAGTGVTVTPAANAITVAVDGSVVGQTITGNDSNALSPSGGNWNIVTANSTVEFTGSGSTLTQDFENATTQSLGIGTTFPSRTSETQNLAIGYNSGDAITSGSNNTLLGYQSGNALTSASDSVAIGSNALRDATTSAQNIAIGSFALRSILTGFGTNVAIGKDSLINITTGNDNVCLGYNTGGSYTTSESNNICIGSNLTGTIGESNVLRLGSGQTACYIDGIDSVNVGNVVKVVTMASDQLGTANITAGTGIVVTPTANTITISTSGSSVANTITGNSGGAISPSSGNWNIRTDNATAQFAGSGSTLTLDFDLTNLCLGTSLPSLTSATNNVIFGATSGSSITSGSANTIIGNTTANSLTTGINNVVIGSGALATSTNIKNSVVIGAGALGSYTTLATTQGLNTVIGYTAGTSLTQGEFNTLLGYSAGSNYTGSESSNILIRNVGTAAENNTLRIGTGGAGSGTISRAFIAGITGVTVSASAPVAVDTNGQLSSLGFGTASQVLTSNGAGSSPTWQAASGGSKPNLNLYFKASDFDVLEANFASLVQDNGTNARVLVRAFDDTTVEYVNFSFGVPGDIDTSGTVTFRVWMYAATAAASKNVELEFEHRAIDNSESWDQTYTAENSGDISIDATQDDITEATWTETVSNLTWAANDLVLAKLSRTAPSANNLSGDLYVIGFRVEIPRS